MSGVNQELRRVGLKVTMPRIKILEILEQNHTVDKHMSAEDVYRTLMEMGEEIGLATVYRVLTQFETNGLVARHNFETGHSVFELARGNHHDHMICVETGDVIEFVDPIIEKRQCALAQELGYELVDHSLVLYVKKN